MKLTEIVIVVVILLIIGSYVAFGTVAWHFISKFW